MRKVSLVLALALLSGMAIGQQAVNVEQETETSFPEVATPAAMHPVERIVTPSYGDLNCAGFLTQQAVPDSTFVAGGLNSPHATRFITGQVVYLSGGSYKDGDRLTFVRAVRDPNKYEYFAGQRKLIASVGQPYAELAQGHIVDTRHSMAIAQLDFSCSAVVPGDLAIPFVAHQKISYRSPVRFDVYALPDGKTTGRIVMAKDFDGLVATGSKVYLTVGSSQGVKVGDYFRVVREYGQDLVDPVDSLSFKASTMEDTQKNPPSFEQQRFNWKNKGAAIHVKDMPRRSLGELIVLSTTPTSATGMITFALEDMRVGDTVEMEAQPASATATAPEPAAPAMAVK